MTVERGLRLMAGGGVLASVSLAMGASPWWLLLTAFAGLNLLQSAFTNWCPMVWVLERIGLARCVPAAESPSLRNCRRRALKRQRDADRRAGCRRPGSAAGGSGSQDGYAAANE